MVGGARGKTLFNSVRMIQHNRSKRLFLLSFYSQPSHCTIPATVMQGYAACGATCHCFQGAIQLAPVGGRCDVGPFVVGVSLVGFGLCTVSAVVLVTIPHGATKVTDIHCTT